MRTTQRLPFPERHAQQLPDRERADRPGRVGEPATGRTPAVSAAISAGGSTVRRLPADAAAMALLPAVAAVPATPARRSAVRDVVRDVVRERAPRPLRTPRPHPRPRSDAASRRLHHQGALSATDNGYAKEAATAAVCSEPGSAPSSHGRVVANPVCEETSTAAGVIRRRELLDACGFVLLLVMFLGAAIVL